MIGAVAQVCDLPVTTAVTCPTVRTHPAIVAQAAATSAVLLGEGRFTLGVGTGEALNEHVLGDRWPHAELRLEMLEEAVEVIRELWTGEVVSREGRHYTVDTARIYTLPDQPPPIFMSAFGPKALDVACRIADGFITTQPDAESVQTFRAAKGADAPTQAGFKVAWGPTRDAAIDAAYELWPNSGVPGELSQVLPSPQHFEQASELVTREAFAEKGAFGPDVGRARRGLRAVRRRRLRRGVRRQHGTALRRHDRGLRVRRAPAAARLALGPRRPQASYSGSPSTSAGFASWPSRPRVRRSSFISASKTWRWPFISSSRARWCRPLARA